MKRLFFLAVVFISGAAVAQNVKDSVAPADNVKAVSRFRNGAIELRWYPTSAAAWRKANQLGYSVKRMEMSDAGSRSGAKELAVIKSRRVETKNKYQRRVDKSNHGVDHSVNTGKRPGFCRCAR